ncbi:MAG: TonB family protein [Planctomycetota bacterium]
MRDTRQASGLRATLNRAFIVLGAVGSTLVVFLVIPLIQAITAEKDHELEVRKVETARLPPPPPPPEPEPEEEKQEQEEPPELEPEAPPLDLQQLELALEGGSGDGWVKGDFSVKLDALDKKGGGGDALFSLADLDQTPRAVYQPNPVLDAAVRRRAPGKVYVLFIVEPDGKVVNPIVQSSTDPIFERPALNAVKKWRFEPGKRNGKAVRFRLRYPIVFPEGL